ncbi:MAG: hypothetical protein ACHQNT_10205, partial [Bacteroidia bacterium]
MRNPACISRSAILFFSCIINFSVQAENNPWTVKWELPKAFIENKSQFNERNLLPGSKILFGVDQGPIQVYFTKDGLTYRIDKKERKSKTEEKENYKSERDYIEREKEEHILNIKTDWVHLEWLDANPDVKVTGLEQTEDYHSYNVGIKNINYIKGFKKLLYKNLYPGIDVEYVFHPQEGIKYSLILHPGANPSLVKIKYSDINRISLDESSNIHLLTLFGDIIDHAPVTFYADNKDAVVPSRFVKNGKIISFEIESYDKSKTIVIDPWTVFPSMPNSNKVWEIEADANGNAYIYGGDLPCRLQKYNSAGGLQWTYTTAGWDSSSWIGTLLTDTAGNCYVTIGSVAKIQKVNTGAGQVWLANGGFLDEYWSLAFNCDYTQLIAGGTRLVGFPAPTGDGRAFNINLNNGNVINSVVVAKAIPSFIFNDINEIRSICASPDGNYYFHTLDTVGSLTTGLTINYRTLTSYSYAYGSPNYGFTPQPQHVIRASANYIYTMNGETLFRRDIANGTVINSITIPGGAYTTPILVQGIAPNNNGIAIDSCGNVYVGSQSQVHKFDANLNLISSAATPSAVYDVAVSENGEILVCGNGFAASINMSACNPPQAICSNVLTATTTQTNVLCNGQCTGTATVNPVGGIIPYTYLWSNGQTTQTATGLCAQTYTVTVTDATPQTFSTTVTITQPAALTVSITSNNPNCNGGTGSATANPGGGTSPYSYTWSNGQTTQTATGLIAGTYTITVTDTNGCIVTDTTLITVPSALLVSTTSTQATCGSNNGTATANPSGGTPGYTYLWNNGQTTQTAIGFPAGTYTVTVTDANSCTQTQTVNVTGSNAPVLTPSQTDIDCFGDCDGAASVVASGGIPPYIYSWNSGQTISAITNLCSGIYTVTVTDSNNCITIQSFNITEPGAIIINTSFTPSTCGIANGTATANPSGGTPSYSYLWSNGQTIQTATGLAAGIYTVTVADGNSCTQTQTVNVTSSNAPVLTPSQTNVECFGDCDGTASFTVSGGTPPYIFSWSNGQLT